MKLFLIEKAAPNFILWLCSYLILGKLLMPFLNLGEPVDWLFLLDWKALVIVAIGALIAIGIGWVVGKYSPALPWFFQKMRDEVSSAITTVTSLCAIIALLSGAWHLTPLILIFGYSFAFAAS